MRTLEARLQKLEAKHGTEPMVIIIRCLLGEMNDEKLIGYDSVSGEVIVRRVDGETEKELLARAKAACTGNPIVLQAVLARPDASQLENNQD